MLAKKRCRVETVGEPEDSVEQKGIEAKKELAKRLMEGEGVEKNDEKAVLLLEECVTLGDADAMFMLGKCCALGRGTKKSAHRAGVLITESVKRGIVQGESLYWLMMKCIGSTKVDISGLCRPNEYDSLQCAILLVFCFLSELLLDFTRKECTDKEGFDPYYVTGAYMLMDMVPLRSMKMGGRWIPQ